MAYTPIKISAAAQKVVLKTASGLELINKITVDSKPLKSSAGTFQLVVEGTSNALFDLQVQRSSDSRYYNFDTRTFASTYSNFSRLKRITPGSYAIQVPSASSGDTYEVQVYTNPAYNTEIDNDNNRYFAKVTKKQFKSTTITLIVSGSGGAIQNTTIGTLTSSVIDDTSNTIKMVDKQLSMQASIVDLGFFITDTEENSNIGTWGQKAMYWETGNYTASGGGTNSTSLTLTSVDGLVVGMQVSSINSVYQSELRAITAINRDTNTVTLDGNETWSDTHVILFRAYGPELINEAIGIKLSVDSTVVKLSKITKTVRTAITTDTATINLNGTTGVGAGARVRIRGLLPAVDPNLVTISAVTPVDLTNGSIVITGGEVIGSERTVRVGTRVHIDGCSNEVFLTGNVNFTRFPSANQNIYIDANKILTAGTDSA
tara:strand:- start:1313 stop:2605 length:1293 start_codon:yes stop_codon:yes gene_type:complete